jgi:hypothetical protein
MHLDQLIPQLRALGVVLRQGGQRDQHRPRLLPRNREIGAAVYRVRRDPGG